MDKTWSTLSLVLWSATIPLILYALLRRQYNALAGLVLLFLIMLIDIFILLNTPNPDKVILVPVVVE